MASEPITIKIDSAVDWNGLTELPITRGDLTVVDQRLYSATLMEPAGIIGGDFFGLFSATTPKLVGVASSSTSPQSVLRVLPGDEPDRFREEVDLSPQMVHVPVFAGDRLAIQTSEGGAVRVDLVVTELADREHVQLALGSPPRASTRRVRIIRTGGTGFNHMPLEETWTPALTWDADRQMMVAFEVVNGVIPARELCMFPAGEGCFVSVRYSGIDAATGRLYVIDGQARAAFEVHGGLKSGEWSKVAYVSHDDLIGLSSPGPAGEAVVCDLEIVRVSPGDRLRGRYTLGS